jgi:4-hydroxy-4-methyl-2-oxoglutarate aldolase
MTKLIVTDVPRADAKLIAELPQFGAATIHEAMGRKGSLGDAIRPIQEGAVVAGSAVTVMSAPGDNLMIHAAIEQCREGDILVVGTTAPSEHGMFGELFATSLMHRGVCSVVLDSGIRDTEALRRLGFTAWSRYITTQGSEKATAGNVNLPITISGQEIAAGDVIVADDDGVVVVPRDLVPSAVEAARSRAVKESSTREAFLAGELGLDRYGMRPLLRELGITYKTYLQAVVDGDLA